MAAALWVYEGPVRLAVQAFKYGGRPELLPGCARAMARDPAVAGLVLGATLVAVPARRRARRRRGYDQAEELAKGLARGLGAPLLTGALRRRRGHEGAQAGATIERRRRQVRGAFRATPSQVAGRTVVLVDDVASTGATLDAAARALRLAGAVDVRAVVLAA